MFRSSQRSYGRSLKTLWKRQVVDYDILTPASIRGLEAPSPIIPSSINMPPTSSVKTPLRVIKTQQEISAIKRACADAREILAVAGRLLVSGQVKTTHDVQSACVQEMIRRGVYPSPLNYTKFPHAICSSVNNIAVHGFPDRRLLKPGDLVSIDVTVYKDGYHGDTCATFIYSDAKSTDETMNKKRNFVQTAEQGMYAGIAAVKVGQPISVVGTAVQKFVKERRFSVIEEVEGHGIGSVFHESLRISHVAPSKFYHSESQDIMIEPGMVFTIEPAIAYKNPKILLRDDGWTVTTTDGSLTAQFEHTIAVNYDGTVYVLT